PGAAAVAAPAAGEPAANHRRPPRPYGRPGRGCLGVAAPGRHRRHRGRPPAGPVGRADRGRRVPPEPAGDRRDRNVLLPGNHRPSHPPARASRATGGLTMTPLPRRGARAAAAWAAGGFAIPDPARAAEPVRRPRATVVSDRGGEKTYLLVFDR